MDTCLGEDLEDHGLGWWRGDGRRRRGRRARGWNCWGQWRAWIHESASEWEAGKGGEGPAIQSNSGLRHLPQSPLPPTPPVLSGFGGDTEAKLWAIFTF